MARTATDGLWRAARRFITVLDANLAAELTEDDPTGLNLSVPSDWFLLPDARSVATHEGQGSPRGYVYFSGPQTRRARTGGPTTRPVRQTFDVGVAVFILDEAGAATFADSWKTLTSTERAHRRAHWMLGAVEDVLEATIRDGDDVLDIQHVRSQIAPPDGGAQPDSGVWATTVWRVDQIINVDQQN